MTQPKLEDAGLGHPFACNLVSIHLERVYNGRNFGMRGGVREDGSDVGVWRLVLGRIRIANMKLFESFQESHQNCKRETL
jgi:hypothetical protein